MRPIVIVIILSFINFGLIYGQQRINGVVKDKHTGIPLENVTVSLISSGTKVKTDNEGKFTFISTLNTDTVLISHLTYNKYYRPVNTISAGVFKIYLIPLQNVLQEVVVNTGFYTISKERATGSFSHLNTDLLNRSVSTDIVSRLENITNGLQFDRSKIVGENRIKDAVDLRVRGVSTIESNSTPLIIIDNFPYDGDLNNINPNDIASVTVLKDAAASSIWGALAGNGVIVITTKQGKFNEKTNINFNSNFSIAKKPDLYYSQSFLPAEIVMKIENELFKNGLYVKNSQTYIPEYVELLIKKENGTISLDNFIATELLMKQADLRSEALKFLYQRSLKQQYALNVTGGERFINYNFSAGYDNNSESIVGNSNNRLNLSLQTSYKPLKNLELTTSIWYTRHQSAWNGLTYEMVFNNARGISSYTRLKDLDGNVLPTGQSGIRLAYQEEASSNGLINWLYRPLDEIEMADNKDFGKEIRLNGGLKYNFFNGLNLNTSYQYIESDGGNESYYAPDSYYVRNLVNRFTQTNGIKIIPHNGILTGTGPYKNKSHSGRMQLNYNGSIGTMHEINGLAGAEMREHIYQSTPGYTLYNYSDDLAIGSRVFDYTKAYPVRPLGTSRIPIGNSVINHITNRYLSYFSNVSYNYQEKYTLSGSVRWDGSNLLGVKTNQKGTALWSTGAGWEISREDFFNTSTLSYLRMRATYGSSGNVDKSQSHYPTITYTANDITGLSVASLNSPGNPFLKWEQVKILNLGIDLAAYDGRLSGSIEGFIKNAKDLLAENLMDPTIGILGSYKINYGNMKSHGVDLQINTINTLGRFKWSSSLLFNYVSNKIINLNTADKSDISYYLAGSQQVKNQSPDVLYALPWRGLDHNTGRPAIFINGEESTDYTSYMKSFNKDNLINVGVSIPPYYGSLRNTFNFLGLELSALITYKFGFVFRRNSMWSGGESVVSAPQYHQDFFKRWKQPGDESWTNVPVRTASLNVFERDTYQYSEALITNGNHIRLQDINLSYKINKKYAHLFGMESIRFYLYANNIGIIWKANKNGIDPDYPNSSYPAPQSLSIGLQVGF